MIRMIAAALAALVGVGFLLVGAIQAANGLPWLLTVSGGLLLLGAAAGLVFLIAFAPGQQRPRLPAPPVAAPPPVTASSPASPAIRNPQSAMGNPPPIRVIPLPSGANMPLHPDAPDEITLGFILALTPSDFEHFCRLLLLAMGYEQVVVQGKTGDEGVDLTMQHDGVLVVAQCKRYRSNIGAPIVREFYGALMHTGAAHGFLITTSNFTPAARDWAAGKPIELVTGAHLVATLRRYLM